VSPGFVRTDWWVESGLTEEESRKLYEESPSLQPEDVADAVLYAVGCPPHVQVKNLLDL
jgi:17beta-estradiol 17-dehydrogenase / 3beta-hydroxysteroid 3-dehydrogenase